MVAGGEAEGLLIGIAYNELWCRSTTFADAAPQYTVGSVWGGGGVVSDTDADCSDGAPCGRQPSVVDTSRLAVLMRAGRTEELNHRARGRVMARAMLGHSRACFSTIMHGDSCEEDARTGDGSADRSQWVSPLCTLSCARTRKHGAIRRDARTS